MMSKLVLRSFSTCARTRLTSLPARNRRSYASACSCSPPLGCKWTSGLWWLASALVVSSALATTSGVYLDSAIASENTVFDPDTSIVFPVTLQFPSSVPSSTFTLVGLGVRTVSFLGIKVYSIGLYAELDNPKLMISKSATSEEKLDHIVRTSACVLRIIPTRSTSYSHLRDGFMRALQARLIQCKQQGLLSAEEEQDVQSSLRTFKSMFPTTTLSKHEPLDILLTPPSAGPRSIVVRDLGAVQNDWIARELVLGYFDGQGLSQKFKKSVFERLADHGE